MCPLTNFADEMAREEICEIVPGIYQSNWRGAEKVAISFQTCHGADRMPPDSGIVPAWAAGLHKRARYNPHRLDPGGGMSDKISAPAICFLLPPHRRRDAASLSPPNSPDMVALPHLLPCLSTPSPPFLFHCIWDASAGGKPLSSRYLLPQSGFRGRGGRGPVASLTSRLVNLSVALPLPSPPSSRIAPTRPPSTLVHTSGRASLPCLLYSVYGSNQTWTSSVRGFECCASTPTTSPAAGPAATWVGLWADVVRPV